MNLIYYTNYAMDNAELSSCVPANVLSEYRLSRLASCKDGEARWLSVAAELLLIHAIRQTQSVLLPLNVVRTGDAKPYVQMRTSTVDFSISHTSGLVCVVVGEGLGVDCERLRVVKPLGRVFLQQGEQLIGEDEDLCVRFLRHWTAKEACIKAAGLGLSHIKSCFVTENEGKIADKVYPLCQFMLPQHIITLAGTSSASLCHVPFVRLKEIL